MTTTPVVQLGPISHIGIAVEDCEKAAAWWERVFGVGPFSTETYVLDASTNFKFKGVPAKARMTPSSRWSRAGCRRAATAGSRHWPRAAGPR